MQASDEEAPVAVSNVVLNGNQLTAEVDGQLHRALLSSHAYHDELVNYCYSPSRATSVEDKMLLPGDESCIAPLCIAL